ncbi:hypothetical protein [Chryseobacterium carnipullorum]|uniref:hypothetical protein n=1 Tax=Chryseobacterium carnipullorum TaxID=1124835 RepID=UPI001E2C4950|nr:hypothetical protein [Chryseobacterium carnipullorum]
MIKTWILYIVLLSLFPVLIFSQQQPGQLASKKDSLMPGMSTSISFSLENPSAEDKIYDVTITASSSFVKPIFSKSRI